jgi:Ca-activated chloride channel family protein
MTDNANQQPEFGNGQHPSSAGNGHQVTIEARWEKPVIAADGGEATLLVRVVAPEQAEKARRAPLDIAFVLDRSGSMRGGKLELAKEGVSLAVSRLRDADRMALVVYDDEVDAIQPLAAATPRVKASLRLALHGVDPGGSTYLSGGWITGCQELAEAPAIAGDGRQSRVRRVILLTDGLANVGMVDPRELAQHAGQLRQRGIATTTLGVGQDFDEGLLSAMAEAGGGNFQYAPDAGALRTFFSRELQELFNVAASGFAVTLTLPPDIDAELVSAFPAEASGATLDVALGDLVCGDAIDLVFTLRSGQGVVGSLLPVGVTAVWTDPRADARHEIAAELPSLRRVDQAELNAVPADALVVERAALQRAAAERRAGLELDRAGRFAESRQRMQAASFMLRAAPMTEAVKADLGESMLLADASDFVAYSSHDRKRAQYREDLRRHGRYVRPTFDSSDRVDDR